MHTSFADYLTTKGILFGIVTDSRVRKTSPNATQVVSLTLEDDAVLEKELRNLPVPDVTAVTVAGYENYIVPAAYITTAYNLPGLTVAAAQAATDKTLMRQAFQAYDQSITPQYAEVTNWSDVELFMSGNNSEDRFLQFLSNLVGPHEVRRRSTSSCRTGSSTSYSTVLEPIFTVADLQSLPRGRALLLSAGNRPTLLRAVPWMDGPHAEAIRASEATYGAGGGLPAFIDGRLVGAGALPNPDSLGAFAPASASVHW